MQKPELGKNIIIDEDISYYASDGRLTEPSEGKRFKWRKMIEQSKKLGRPLTELEAMQFQTKEPAML